MTNGSKITLADHEIAQLINELKVVAKTYHSHGCLREKIRNVVLSKLKPLPHQKEYIADEVL